MSISTTIPESWKLPLFWGVVDGSQAGNLTEDQPALLVAQAFIDGAATAALKAGSTGNGTIAMDSATPVLVGAQVGVYKAVFSTATAYTVKDPSGNTVGTGATGGTFSNQVKFVITAGATPFASNDEFDITVTKVPTGTAVPNVPIPIGSAAVAAQQFGSGSMAERMVTAFMRINTTQELWVAPLADMAAGIAATASILFTSTAVSSGILNLYIAGQLVQITVFTTDTLADIASNLVAAINAVSTLPCTAAVDGVNTAKVNLTCRWLGLTGNDIQMALNYLGLNGGQQTPNGLQLTITPFSGGDGEPDFTDVIANIAPKQYYHVGLPYNDTASLGVWDTEYGFGQTGRWSFQRQQYGWVFNAYRGDYADALEWGATQNSAVITTMAIEPLAQSPIWEWTAAYCALGAYYLLDDPARPLQTLPLAGILPALVADRFSQTEINTLTNNGFAVQAVNPSGVPAIVREALQYQFNSYGQADTAFSLLTILSNLAELLSRMKSAITSKYPRHKLAPDGTRFGPGQAIVTPSILKAELVSEARQAEYDGLMSNVADFIKNLIVEIDDTNPNRANVLWAPQLMGQLRQFDVLAQFRLAYNTLPTS
jgi:phage tail sheath gpL-like